MKVLVVGDTHGDAKFVASVNKLAKVRGCRYVVQLGDFNLNFNKGVLASIRAWLNADERRRWLWVDGNHDDHDYIRSNILKGKHPKKPVAHFHDRLMYCPRGSTLRIGNTKALFMGGAVSIDKHRRMQGVDWWPQESISVADTHRAIANGREAEILFSHDAPNSKALKGWLKEQGYRINPEAYQNREAIGNLIEGTAISTVMHGHYHYRYLGEYAGATVEGLAANYSRGRHTPTAELDYNCVLLDL